MPLYNNVITNMNREDTPDEDKLGYEFWNAVEELPVIKQIKDWNENAAQKSEYWNERARSGKEGLLVQGLQVIEDTLGTVVGLPFQALETGIQAVSDRTNIDPRTLGAVKDIIGYSRAVKVSKSGKFYKGVQTAKKNIPRADILNPGQITVKPITPNQGAETINKVWGLKRTKPPTALIPKYAQNAKIYLGDQPPTSTFMTTTGGGANYDPILGEDELTESFRPQWQRKARQGDKTFYYDITGHRILDVPGMDNPAEQSRYKSWLTQSLINRYNSQLLNPETPFTHFHSNQSFYDSQGMEWRLVRTDKNASGPDQPYEPMPLNEIDSRKLKAENTSEEERVLLRELMKLNVTDRNALERENPWLIQWNSDTSGQNYHEHMIGLDETEFWNSGAGKALGYMNNDVYDLEKGLGNIVFLNDPRFKAMKDSIAEYITPSSKEEVYPGLKRRINPIKTFTGGPYAGMNAVIGYDANPKSNTYTNLVIRAYNPSPDVNESQIVATIPNWYANVYAKDLTTGERIIPEDIANNFIRSYVDAVLEGNEPGIVALEDLTEQLLKDYGIEVEIPAPGGLQQIPDYQSLGEATLSKPVDPDPLDLKTFKTTPKIQRARDKWWKKQFLLWQKGKYTQLELNLDEEFPDR